MPAPNLITPLRPKLAMVVEYGIDFQGGVSVPCRALIHGLADQFDIVLVTPDTPEEARNSSVSESISGHVQWKAGVNKPQVLADELADRKVDLAHFHLGGNFGFGGARPGRSPIIPVAKRGIKVFSTVHMVVNLFDGYCGPNRSKLVKVGLLPIAWVTKMEILRHVDAEIVTSKRAYNWLRSWYAPLRSRFELIYQSRLNESDLPKSGNERDCVILYAGHVATRKGQHVLVEAFALVADEHPRWRLELRGSEVEEGSLRRLSELSRRHNLEPQITLPQPHSNAPELMRRASIYAQPSFFEGLPLALQEAMLCGCACVATDIPGNNELIAHNKTGLLVPPGNSEAMANALRRLMNDEKLRQRLAMAGQASVIERGMTCDKMISAYEKLYERALRTH